MSDHQPKPRNWTIDGDPLSVETEEELVAAIHESAAILSRIGGAIVIIADREQISPDHWQTTRYLFRWNSFAPAKRIEPEPLPEPDLEPVAALD